MNLEQSRVPDVTILAFWSSLAAVGLSLAPAFLFPWNGTTAQQEQAAGLALIAVGLVFSIGISGLVLAAVGIAQRGLGATAPWHTRSAMWAVFALALLVLAAAGLQCFAYMFTFAFIGG